MIRIKERFGKLKFANLPNSKETARKYKHKEIIKLFYNENKFGASPNVKKRIEINSPHIYPEYGEPELTKKLASMFDLHKDNFYISNGSDAIIDSIPTLFASKELNQNVIIPELTFGRIEATCIVEGIEVRKVDLNDGKIDLDKMLSAINKNTAIIYIVNPNMPTGKINDHKEMMNFLKKVPKDVLVLIDEAYIEFSYGIEQTYINDKKIIDKFDNVIITHTWSKLYGLAAFRIGYMISRPYIVNLFRKAYQYLPINKYSLQAAESAMDDKQYYDEIIKKINDEKDRYYKILDELKISYYESQGNFIYVMPNKAKEFEEHMLKKYGVGIRVVRDKHLRITIGTPQENDLVFKGLREFYGKSK